MDVAERDLVVGENLTRWPAGTWLYASGPRPTHRLVVRRVGHGVLGRRRQLVAAARRQAGRRWTAGQATSVVPRTLHKPLHRALVQDLHPGRRRG